MGVHLLVPFTEMVGRFASRGCRKLDLRTIVELTHSSDEVICLGLFLDPHGLFKSVRKDR